MEKFQLFSRKFIQYLGGDIRNLTILLLLSLSFGAVTDIDGKYDVIADLNGDGNLNILDIVQLVNIILGG